MRERAYNYACTHSHSLTDKMAHTHTPTPPPTYTPTHTAGCHSGTYVDDNGETIHFKYQTKVYPDGQFNPSEGSNLDGVRVKLYQSSGGSKDGWCGGKGMPCLMEMILKIC